MITTDNGTEFATLRIIARKLNTVVYFTHPYSPWEKRTIENACGLIRQYLPKNANLKGISKCMIGHVMEKINNRPRKNGFIKPVDIDIKNFM
jgi:IS30 family transposase